MIAADHPLTMSLAALVQAGDIDGLQALLVDHPSLATERFGDAAMSRTALHVATDWPGHRTNTAATIATLVAAGADVDARFAGPHEETALQWAASSDDVAAIDALLDAGASIDADGAVLTGGTPLADAVVFAQWNAARRLVARGAAMTVWQAAALGEADEVRRHLGRGLPRLELDNACWHACRAGQSSIVELLADAGADLDWLGHEQLTSRQAGLQSGNDELTHRLAANPAPT